MAGPHKDAGPARSHQFLAYCDLMRLKALCRSDYITGGAAGAGAPAPACSPFTKSFNSLLGLKNGIFLAGTSTRSPVLGLRPMRACAAARKPRFLGGNALGPFLIR